MKLIFLSLLLIGYCWTITDNHTQLTTYNTTIGMSSYVHDPSPSNVICDQEDSKVERKVKTNGVEVNSFSVILIPLLLALTYNF